VTVFAIVVAVIVGLLLFAVTLIVITYSSAWVADVTGHFRTLFVRQPLSRAFRAARWLVAALVSIGAVDAVVLEALL
jgi:hypothetical protein